MTNVIGWISMVALTNSALLSSTNLTNWQIVAYSVNYTNYVHVEAADQPFKVWRVVPIYSGVIPQTVLSSRSHWP